MNYLADVLGTDLSGAIAWAIEQAVTPPERYWTGLTPLNAAIIV